MKRCMGCMEVYEEKEQICPYCGYREGTAPKETYHMIPGSILYKRYIIGRVLGFGGFGVTYVAWDALLETKVAIKEFLPGEFSTRVPGQETVTIYSGERQEQFEAGLKKFIEEAQMLAKFQNTPGVVAIYNSFCENNTAYIVMEFLEGETLKERLKREGKIVSNEVMNIALPLITALKEVHKVGILHRDIAPDNIFLTRDGEVRLIDFGASRFATTTHSKSLSVIIKQGYAPEEQYRSKGDQGPWTDVYALAATMYNMLTGVVPEDAMERAVKDEMREPSKLGISLPKNMETAIMNALNIKIENRTPDMETFEKELFSTSEVYRIVEKIKRADVGKWPLWAKVLFPTLGVLAVGFVTLILTGVIQFELSASKEYSIATGFTKVPNIINITETAAVDKLKNMSLGMQIVDKQYSDIIDADLVLDQDISGGKEVEVGTDIQIVISAGKEKVLVGDVLGIPLDEAQKQLEALGILVEVEEIFSSTAAGAVVSQSISPGESLEKGATIVLQISKGLEKIDKKAVVEVPDLQGRTYENAKTDLDKLKLYIERGGAIYSNTVAKGQIISQSVAAGTEVNEGTTIVVTVSLGIEMVQVPDVQYKDESEAVASVINAGLQVNVQREYSDTVAANKVIRQSLNASTQVEKGTEIVLYISMGRKETLVVQTPETQVQQGEIQSKNWSEWGETLPDGVSNDKYIIEEKTQYSYRDKKATTSTNASLVGWSLESSETSYSDWGAWSDWSQTAYSESDTIDAETATWYRYRDKEFTKANSSTLSGWTGPYKTDESWSSWSGWSDVVVAGNNNKQVETQQVDDPNSPIYKTQYQYSRVEVYWDGVLKATGPSYASVSGWSGDGIEKKEVSSGWRDTPMIRNGESGDSSHSAAYIESQSGGWRWYNEQTQQVHIGYNKKTQYRYRDKVYTYHFWRWKNWSSYSPESVSATNDREVQTATYYRYRNRNKTVTYHFYQWTDWSSYSDAVVNKSSTREVQTRTLYRYKLK